MSSRSKLAQAMLFMLLWVTGCGDNQGNFVFTQRTEPTQPATFNLTVQADPATLNRVNGRWVDEVTEIRVEVHDIGLRLVAEETVPRTGVARFALPPALYLVRLVGLDAQGNVQGYFLRVVDLRTQDRAELIPGLILTTDLPPLSFPDPQDPPFLVFTGFPSEILAGQTFSVEARVFDALGYPSNTSGVSLTSNPISLQTAPGEQDSGGEGIVTFANLRFPTSSSGTTRLTVQADGVEPATTDDITVNALPDAVWRWENPTVPFETYGAIWGTGPDNIFMVGDRGTLLRFDGRGWRQMWVPTYENLTGVWGVDANNVYAVGSNGTILRFDGESWSEMTSGTTEQLFGIWGTALNNVYACGTNGTLLHYDGNGWSSVTSGTNQELKAIWGSDANNVYVCGGNGTMLRYNGSSWAPLNTGTSALLNGIWGTAPDNVWAVGSSTIIRYDGSTWTPSTIPSGGGLDDIFGFAPDLIYVVGDSGRIFRFDGTDWNDESGSFPPLLGVWGSGPSNVYACGRQGGLARFDGTGWSSATEDLLNSVQNFRDVWASSANDVFAVGTGGTIAHYDGTEWTLMNSPSSDSLYGVWGSAPNDVFAVGQGTVLHYNGSDWTAQASPTTSTLQAVWGTASNNVFAVGYNSNNGNLPTLFRYDGNTWSDLAALPTSGAFFDLWGFSSTNIWIVGDRGVGTVWHYDGSNISQEFSAQSSYLTGVWGIAPNDVWAVGYDSSILRYNGTSWTEDFRNDGWELMATHGTGANDVFFVGEERNPTRDANILRYNGSMVDISGMSSEELRGVWAIASDNVYAVGDRGSILHYSR